MKVVVSDTSPIINLARINHLNLLPAIFGEIIIPQKVYDEIVIQGFGQSGAKEISQAHWIIVKSCSDSTKVRVLEKKLDSGEAEAIVLAQEINADLLLLDDNEARTIANSLNLEYTGLLGVLLVAKKLGFIKLVKPVMDDLMIKAKFRISAKIYASIIKLAGEL